MLRLWRPQKIASAELVFQQQKSNQKTISTFLRQKLGSAEYWVGVHWAQNIGEEGVSSEYWRGVG